MAAQRVKEVCTTAASALREAERQTTLKKKGFVSDAREDAAKAMSASAMTSVRSAMRS